MKTIRKVSLLKKILHSEETKGNSIGFVPTMGALHDGHMSLVKKSTQENDITVVSIFVNPTQFNEKSDLDKYPRTLQEDEKLLIQYDCDYVFAPYANEIYPEGLETVVDIDLGYLTQPMEGEFRDGHFEGVVQVVKRLLDIVEPSRLYMGQKDWQQFTIIQYMLDHFDMNVELRVCPIMREESGLAMSSRNQRLDPEIKKRATVLSKVLSEAKEELGEKSIADLENEAISKLNIPDFKPEYFTIVNGKTLKPIENLDKTELIVACTAVWAGDVRLIDNMVLKGEL